MPCAAANTLTFAVADDVPEIRVLATQWLTAAGHRVHCAADGVELLQLVRDHPVDVVITDVMMPESDGFEVIRAVKASRPEVKIVTISGGATVMPMEDCLRVAKALGADAVLAKPFKRIQLLAVIESLRLG